MNAVPVRVVFNTLDRCRNVELATLEVDQTVGALVTATLEAGRYTTRIVATALGGQTFGQALDGLALVEARTVDDHQLALAGVTGLKCLSAMF